MRSSLPSQTAFRMGVFFSVKSASIRPPVRRSPGRLRRAAQTGSGRRRIERLAVGDAVMDLRGGDGKPSISRSPRYWRACLVPCLACDSTTRVRSGERAGIWSPPLGECQAVAKGHKRAVPIVAGGDEGDKDQIGHLDSLKRCAVNVALSVNEQGPGFLTVLGDRIQDRTLTALT